MSRKNKAPKEHKEPRPAKPFDPAVKKAVSIFLVFLLIFCVGNFLGSLNAKQVTTEKEAAPQTTAAPQVQTTAAPLPQTTAAPATTAAEQQTTPDASEQTTAAGADSTTAAASASTMTKAEILKLFTDSANKIKTNATKVTRNYEDLKHNEEHLEMPTLLKSVGSGLISKFLKRNDTPVEYASNADIVANYPVKNQTYVINSTEADLTDATCTDDGTNYNITLKFAECTDPQGTGCATAFNIITPEEIKEGSGGIVSESSVRYYDASITCKIDKATGNMIAATYTLPMVLSVKAMGINAAVGMTFEHDYTIAY